LEAADHREPGNRPKSQDIRLPTPPPVPPRGGEKKVVVTRAEVESVDLSRVRGVVEAEADLLAKGKLDSGDLVVTLDGYNSDPRELWQIPEVQAWFGHWHAAQPCAPYFLAPGTVLLYVAAQIGAEPVPGGFRASRTSPRRDELRREVDEGFKAFEKRLSAAALARGSPGDFAAFVRATAPVAAFGLHRKGVLDAVFSGDGA
jgi:hypothetical protein